MGTLALTAAVACALLLASPAAAQVQPYGTNDYGGFRNILPPGQGQNVNVGEAAAFLGGGTLPQYFDDQREMYGDLVFATPGLSAAAIDDYFKDGSFGVKPGDVGRTYQPDPAGHPGLTVIRDAGYGVPHVYGTTRSDVMFGAGYVGAEDRLFFMDVLRHAGRAKLSSFAGPSNKAMDAEQWEVAPYTEQDLQRQYDLADEVYGAEGAGLQQDVDDYVAGINKYIGEARLDYLNKMPAEYAAILKPAGPTDWKVTDVIATASLIGGIFGKGGGGELGNAEVNSAAKERFGEAAGDAVWADFRQANDPEAPTTVRGQNFPYQERTGVDPDAVAIPKPGTLQDGSPDDAPSLGGVIGGILGGLGGLPGGSNALLVSGAESDSGHPLAVFGPQVAYFAPQILMEEDLHGPDIDARGATFTGVNLYVLLGRGQDYAWSATSAGQDIIDTFAEKLCEPNGDAPTVNSMHYLYKGDCRPIEVLENTQLTNPNPGDPGPGPLPAPELYTLKAQRTVHGVISKRGIVEVNGEDVPVAFARLRSTYFHEADSARAFSAINRPSKVQSAEDFQKVMNDINFTFNWFYADDKDIAYFNSGANPVRAPGTDPEYPTWGTGEWDWQGWDPVTNPNAPGLSGGTNFADYTPFDQHPQAINQDFLTSWNNKQAPGYRSAEAQYGYSSIYRSDSLDERIEPEIAGGETMSLQELIDAMEDAGTVDLRGSEVLPWMLEVIESGPGGVPADLADEAATLEAWIASGAHRRDRDRSGAYDDSAAVRLMDAWWDPPGDPLTTPTDPKGALEAAFQRTLGDDLFRKIRSQLAYDNPPNNHGAHLGSAYQDGWWGQFEKDLRAILGESVQGAHSRTYCGAPDQSTEGTLTTCRAALVDSLRNAAGLSAEQIYAGDDAAGCDAGDQMCFDEVRFRVVGAVSVDPIHWINRPTWQQVVEVQGHRGRSPEPQPGGSPPTGQGGIQSGVRSGAAKSCRKKVKRKHRSAALAKKKKRACAQRKKERR
jgi:acyl-homoserine lactone acylase PvdQ